MGLGGAYSKKRRGERLTGDECGLSRGMADSCVLKYLGHMERLNDPTI